MAKKTSRILIRLVCNECKEHNYTTQKNKTNTEDKIEIKKFCKRCGKHTAHKETTKLK